MKLMTPNEAYETLKSNSNAVYLDVRTETEFAVGHPAGAINIPVFVIAKTGTLQQNPQFLAVAKAVLRPEQIILCGCRAGGRSHTAAEILLQAGYSNVVNVLGGFGGGPHPEGGKVVGWRQAGLPVSTDTSADVAYSGLRAKAGV